MNVSNQQARRRRSTVVQAFQRDFSGDQTCSFISFDRSQRVLGDQRSPQSALERTQRPQRFPNWTDVTAPSGTEVDGGAQTDATLSLALVLTTELRRGKDSRWFGYLQSLPAEGPPLAIFWSDAEDVEVESRWAAVSRRIRGTQLERHLNAPQTKQYTESIRQYFLQTVKAEWLPDCEWKEFRRAYALVSSRAFWVDTYHGLALVPVADAFNHIEENHVHLETDWQVCSICGSLDTCEHDEDTNDDVENSEFAAAATKGSDHRPRAEHTYDMVANRPIEGGGEEVYNTYDSRGISNVELLCRYGFMLEGNSKDVISFEEDDVRVVCESVLSASHLENYVDRIGNRYPFVPASGSKKTAAASYPPRPHSSNRNRNRQKIDVAATSLPLIKLVNGHVVLASARKLLEDAGVVQQSNGDQLVMTEDRENDYAKGGSREAGEATMLDSAAGLDGSTTTMLGTTTGPVRERMMVTKEEDATSVGQAGVMSLAVCVGKGPPPPPIPSSSAADVCVPLTRSVKDEQGASEALKEREQERKMTSSPSFSPLSSLSSSHRNVAGFSLECGYGDGEANVVPPSIRTDPLTTAAAATAATARMEIDAEGLVSKALWTRLVCEVYCRLMEAISTSLTGVLSPSAGTRMIDTSSAIASTLTTTTVTSFTSPFSAGSTLRLLPTTTGEGQQDRNRPTQPLVVDGLERVEVQVHGQGHYDTYSYRGGGDQDREGGAGNKPGVGPERVVRDYQGEVEFGADWVENQTNRDWNKGEKGKGEESFSFDLEDRRVYFQERSRDFLSIKKRSRAASAGSNGQEEEEGEEEVKFGRRKRPKLEEETDMKDISQGEGEEDDGSLEVTRMQTSFVIEVVRLVSRLMQELCYKRLEGMWNEQEEGEGIDPDDSVLDLATRYVTSERALLQACMSSWQDLENQLEFEVEGERV